MATVGCGEWGGWGEWGGCGGWSVVERGRGFFQGCFEGNCGEIALLPFAFLLTETVWNLKASSNMASGDKKSLMLPGLANFRWL